MLCGIFTTLLIPETKRKTLEELAGEVPGTAMYDAHLARGRVAPSAQKLSSEGSNGDEYAATGDRKETSSTVA